nr:DUF3108 domain-containing protein [Hyphomicrobiales bacterium]
RPDSYSFDYSTNEKRGNIDVAFNGNAVTQLDVTPPMRKSSRHVPITRTHMKGVVDPLSALVMLSKSGLDLSSRQVCSGRLPIFDGNARYDLRLSYKHSKPVVSGYGYRGKAYVCKVKFVPISGHKQGDEESEFAAKTNGIEVWMVPLKKAGIHVPHHIKIPTLAGTAYMTALEFGVKPVDHQNAMLDQ